MNDSSPSWATKNGFSTEVMAIVWLIAAFFMFQVVGSLVGLILVLAQNTGFDAADQVLNVINQRLDLLFIGNSVGQIVVLGLGTWLFSSLIFRKENRKEALRLLFPSGLAPHIGIGISLMVVAQPLVWFMGYLNYQIPFPDAYMAFEEQQNRMLENFLRGDYNLIFALFHVALTPAICEELMMRGFMLRVFEQRRGIIVAIIASSLLFGLFHVRLTQIIPLSMLGSILAILAWKSNSLIPAMIGHFVNNGASIILAKTYPDVIFDEMAPEIMPNLGLVLASLVLTATLLRYYLKKIRS